MAQLNTKTSVVDYLKSQGKDSSLSARKKLATSLGISNYSGTYTQNTQLLKALQSEKTTKNTTNQNKKTTTNTTKTTTSNAKATTSNNKTTTKNLNGVDDATTKKMTSTYTPSSTVTNADKKSNNALSNLETLVSKEDIISDSVWDGINSQFVVPSAVTEADAYLKSQLEKIQSGKTSYTDQVKDMMAQIQNREKFSYDVDTDPLFQQALASAMNSGKQAMQDTIGQASALTGGYGSTYATSVGNQAYNSFIEDAYDNLPQYYQMALEAYQMEGDEMYRQLGMLTDADDREYNRNVTAYDATYQHRNQIYNEAYNQYRDNKSDAFAMANLQLSEHGQKVSDAYNYYSASSDYANTLYNREYTKWSDEVNQAMQYAQLLNSDYWNQTNFDEGVRQYEKTFAENVRQFDTSFAEEQRQFDKTYDQTEKWNQKDLDYKYAALKQDNDQFYAGLKTKSSGSGGSGGKSGSGSSLTDSQLKSAKDVYVKAGGGDAGLKAVDGYLSTIGKNNLGEEATDYLLNSLNGADIPTYYQNWTITKDTKNWFGGDDNNDVYSNGTTTMKYKDLEKSLDDSELSEAEKQTILNKWKNQSKK